jgi:hypothetical protein
MRFLLGLVLLVFLSAVGIFAFQNTLPITVRFLSWGVTAPVAVLAVACYLLGMISGWNVVAFLRRSIRTVSTPPREA